MLRQKIKLAAYAKINLSLNITGVLGEMHTLDMVMASADIADVVTVCARPDGKINIEYSDPAIKPGSDSVTKAVSALKKHFGEFGADIFIEKNIPAAAGLGGSGVDAAAALRAFDLLFGFRENGVDETAVALKTGSDVPYLLRGGFARVRATGGDTEFFDSSCEFYAVIAKEETGVLSGESYRAFDGMYPEKKFCPSDNGALIYMLKNGDKDGAFRHMDNALQMPSLSLNPAISGTLAALGAAGAAKTVMTGSGSACVGFFGDFDQAERAAQQVRKKGLWARAVKTLPQGIKIL